MHFIEALNIIGYHNEAVPNTFFRQKSETKHLAVLLPGLGYTTHMPLLYYSCLELLYKHANVIRADCNYIRNADFMALAPDERRRWAAEDAMAVFKAAISQFEYDKITLVGKSMGTSAMGHLITSKSEMPRLHCIWLTPLLKNEHLLSQIKQVRQHALFVVGTSDPYYDEASLEDLLKTTGGEGIIVEDANHSLEIEGNPTKSLQALVHIMKGIRKFLG